MKQTTTTIAIVVLSCIGFAGVAESATVNDRSYVAAVSPSVVAPGSTTTYNINVTNDLKSGP
jgi:hypothetical protein